MKHHKLQEVAKFCAGLVAGDFLAIVWVIGHGIAPFQFMGATWSQQMLLPALVFDAALFLILVHYGWHVGKMPKVKERTYLFVAGAIFAIVAVAHFARLFFGVDLSIAGWVAPLSISWIALAVSTFLAYTSFHFFVRLN
jgi:hypothetical protein